MSGEVRPLHDNLHLLFQAARVSPLLRDAVLLVEGEVKRLEAENERLRGLLVEVVGLWDSDRIGEGSVESYWRQLMEFAALKDDIEQRVREAALSARTDSRPSDLPGGEVEHG